MKLSRNLSLLVGGLLLSACAATATGRLSECFEIFNGGASYNLLSNTATVTGFCINRLNSFCNKLVDCKAGYYIDTNNNGTMDPGEPRDIDSEANPGDKFCQGQLVISNASQYAGATLRWNLEAFEELSDGTKKQLKSTEGSYKLPG